MDLASDLPHFFPIFSFSFCLFVWTAELNRVERVGKKNKEGLRFQKKLIGLGFENGGEEMVIEGAGEELNMGLGQLNRRDWTQEKEEERDRWYERLDQIIRLGLTRGLYKNDRSHASYTRTTGSKPTLIPCKKSCTNQKLKLICRLPKQVYMKALLK